MWAPPSCIETPFRVSPWHRAEPSLKCPPWAGWSGLVPRCYLGRWWELHKLGPGGRNQGRGRGVSKVFLGPGPVPSLCFRLHEVSISPPPPGTRSVSPCFLKEGIEFEYEWPPQSHTFECSVTRMWNSLKRLEGLSWAVVVRL